MLALEKALVAGGGIGGMATAIRLRQEGVAVDLIDADPDWRVYGAGITITGPTLRAYSRLGLLDKLKAEGAVTNGIRILNVKGELLADMDEPAIEDGLPATGGILRPALHRLMSEEVGRLGVDVRLGVTIKALEQDASGVDVTFNDGARRRYDLVVGADGIYSGLRALLFAQAVKPRYTGQCSWRILADRPQGFDKGEFYLGHQNLVGITACSAEKVYVFVLNTDPDRTWIAPEDQPAKVRELLADFGGNIAPIRERVGRDSSVVYRPLESALQPKPWYVGRVVLIGDAVHATTPHLASGAGLAVEDALVLAEELERRPGDVEGALAAFTERRYDRCRFVVESSVRLGEVQMQPGGTFEVGRMVGEALHHLAEDI